MPGISVAPYDAGLYGPVDLSVEPYFDRPDLGKLKPLRCQPETWFLRIANGIVLPFTLIPGVTGLADSILDSSEEGLKGTFDPEKHILENLGMHLMKRGYPFLVRPENFLLTYTGKPLAGAPVMIAPVGKAGVIENTAYF
jgi:hypothetical protein